MNYTILNKNQSKTVLKILKEKYSPKFSNAQVHLNTIANNNRIFLVKTKEDKYIFRESNSSKLPQHLKFEVTFLTYLHKKNFHLTPYIIPNAKGGLLTIYKNKYYILENFLPGTVKKSVNNLVNFNQKKLIGLFSALAKFSRASQDFIGSIPKSNQTIFDYNKNGNKLFAALIKKIKNKKISDLLISNAPFINKFVKETQAQLLNVNYDMLQKQIVHFDLHPGNVNYIDDELSGIFDFDWVRFDNRFADLACTIGQSCYQYKGKNRALYDKDKIALGLKTYRKEYGKSEYSARKEKAIISAALRGYMFFQLLWIIEWHIKNPTNKDGLRFIQFSLDVLKLNNFDTLIN